MPVARSPRRAGFTLIELLVVMAIIGIIISLILVAAADGVRRAEERQTQALITKLESAMSDRIDALLATTAPINQTHRYLAAYTYKDASNNGPFPVPGSDLKRAQVIAQFDYMKAELPDVFVVNTAFGASYPLNFAALPYPFPNNNPVLDDFALPLGNRSPGLPYVSPTVGPYIPTPGYNPITGYNNGNGVFTNQTVAQDSGMFGASYTAAAGFYKSLYEAAAADVIQASPGASVNARRGYDAADNNGDGYVDNLAEVLVSGGGASAADFQAAVTARLGKHTHKTARSEALYAVLVEGLGPLGSAFNREEFSDRDVADTDGDGLPEFIDAWGEPLQFYRWPIYYGPGDPNVASSSGSSADSQKGYQSYRFDETRQQDPLDTNQLLVSPAWWANGSVLPYYNAGLPYLAFGMPPNGSFSYSGSPASPQANAFMTYFHIIIDPLASSQPSNSPTNVFTWDRTGDSQNRPEWRRRAFYSKFLILSGGPDRVPGTFQLGLNYKDIDSVYADRYPLAGFPSGNLIQDVQNLNWCESQAAQFDHGGRSGTFLEVVSQTVTSDYLQNIAGVDDITNQNLSAPGAGAK
ncbi:type II secretion system protein [Tundrisphaera lichenicola]|uniref:type II secretion system protein n=1 Tax=Tundrisphaera lichenicola TaxID=2029860 RepID=UPI003EBD2F9D